MREESEIVKILKEEERRGKISENISCSYENLQTTEKSNYSDDTSLFYSDDNEKKLKDMIRLENLEGTYRTIFENYAIAVTIADKDERIISWNKYAEELFNMNEKDLFMLHASFLYPSEEWEKIRKENIRKKGIKNRLETKMIRKDIGSFDVELSLCILKGVDGKTVGSVGIIKDVTKLKQTERMLKDSIERYKTIFENSAVAITLTDANEKIVSWNKYAEELFGFDKNDLSDKYIKSLYPSEEWRKIREKNLRQKGMQHHFETKVIGKNNELIDVDISLSILKDNEGKIIGSIGVLTDISERKLMERRLTSIMEYADDSIYLIDKNYRYLMVNNELLLRFDKNKENILGKTIRELHFKKNADVFIKKIDFVFNNGESIRYEHCKNDKWFLRTISPVKDYLTGEITSVLVISKDITEIKKAQEGFLENEKKYRTIFEFSPNAILRLDKKGNVLDVNGRMCEWLKYDQKEIIGRNFLNLPFLSKECKAKFKEKNLHSILDEKTTSYELDFTTKNGTKRIGMVQTTPLKDEKGKVYADLVVINDITTRKKMEEELRIKESAIASSINAIIIADLNGKLTYVNNSFLKMWGYDKSDEVLAKPIISLLQKDEKTSSLLDILSDKGGWIGELKGVKKDRSKFFILLSASTIKDDFSKPICIMASFIDITQQKQASKALIKSEEKFRVVLENSQDMIYQLNLQTKTYDYVSPSSVKVTGYNPDEIISNGFDKMNELIHPDDRIKIENNFNNMINNKPNKNLVSVEEYRIKHKKLGYRWISDTRSIMFDDNGQIALIVGNAKDITEKKKVWNEMVKSEEKYRVLAETSADGVFTTDVLGRLTYVNPSLEKMIGRRKGNILATPFKNYLSESSVYDFQQVMVDIREKENKMESIELGIIHEDGFIVPVEANVSPLKKDGVFVGIECTVRDVSEQEKVLRELKKSENLRTEFMNIAAHELKSPVTPIKGYLELIESDKNVDEKIRKWARIALRNSERLLLLVNDILDVSRLDTDTMRFNMEKIDSAKLLDDAAEDMKPAIENKNLKFIRDIPKNLPMILADKNRLSQVLKNLLGNAIKFTDNGSITLKADVDEKNLVIYVEDTGVGISSGELDKIFTKLYQAYTGEDRKNEGAGLGLYICREIIKKHKGEIWADSKIGKGSKFTIQIPI